ncbi:hypothetical protein E2C01_041405 [Portunus trituberculatus]|uniref:Uncharacterized protein n=1 Tax=Portunus trituberculatus TaxID=210409 RepID=A0A5B7FMI6_PORTR|nr:hypothetical protein [Portunus trituberculatus]
MTLLMGLSRHHNSVSRTLRAGSLFVMISVYLERSGVCQAQEEDVVSLDVFRLTLLQGTPSQHIPILLNDRRLMNLCKLIKGASGIVESKHDISFPPRFPDYDSLQNKDFFPAPGPPQHITFSTHYFLR